ncbi:hypothetical protein B0J12DRAFT_706126 [Macrophomina phaseolina]|uniref:C2H2-type domain-containing protein n=1 Tax=Macrophomina phaseolina TaxID=35725 RepID=A0ABQ8FSP6_9PEZI|nr:hypothetical protein B0J12DRAFT_706126 [Macrophomina phaseolina]
MASGKEITYVRDLIPQGGHSAVSFLEGAHLPPGAHAAVAHLESRSKGPYFMTEDLLRTRDTILTTMKEIQAIDQRAWPFHVRQMAVLRAPPLMSSLITDRENYGSPMDLQPPKQFLSNNQANGMLDNGGYLDPLVMQSSKQSITFQGSTTDHDKVSNATLETMNGVPNSGEHQDLLALQEPNAGHNQVLDVHPSTSNGILGAGNSFTVDKPLFMEDERGISCSYPQCAKKYKKACNFELHWCKHFQDDRASSPENPLFKEEKEMIVCLFPHCFKRFERKGNFTTHWRRYHSVKKSSKPNTKQRLRVSRDKMQTVRLP